VDDEDHSGDDSMVIDENEGRDINYNFSSVRDRSQSSVTQKLFKLPFGPSPDVSNNSVSRLSEKQTPVSVANSSQSGRPSKMKMVRGTSDGSVDSDNTPPSLIAKRVHIADKPTSSSAVRRTVPSKEYDEIGRHIKQEPLTPGSGTKRKLSSGDVYGGEPESPSKYTRNSHKQFSAALKQRNAEMSNQAYKQQK
jgi:hypothetical protein